MICRVIINSEREANYGNPLNFFCAIGNKILFIGKIALQKSSKDA